MKPGVLRFVLAAAVLVLAAVAAVSCGGTSARLDEQQAVVDKAIQAAEGRDSARFLALVAPSFRDQARQQMPDVSEEDLGSLLASGFLEGLPFAVVKNAKYETEVNGDKAVVHLYGTFNDSQGAEVKIGEGEALRVPLVNEGGRWYLDLLDI
jgi:hypothetical protein